MNFQDTIAFLYTQLPMFQKLGEKAFKKDLTNIRLLCDALGNPQNNFKAIHIGGTNGKGSVSSSLYAILLSQGYEVGLYTSPHLLSFTERIRVNGKEITQSWVIDWVENMKPLIEKIGPSFFELTVAMAFDYFSQKKVEYAVIEVGLGGRLDSTNILAPILTIITNVSLDHQHILGDSLEEIAFEKAGIIKTGCPIIIGKYQTASFPVFHQLALQREAPLFMAEQLFSTEFITIKKGMLSFKAIDLSGRSSRNYQCDLAGHYQLENMQTVLAAIKILQSRGIIIHEKSIIHALQKIRALSGLRGRMELLSEHPTILADIAHNEDAVRWVVSQIMTYRFAKAHIIWGSMKDKAITSMLDLLPSEASYYFCAPKLERALEPSVLKERANSKALQGESYDTVAIAVSAAISAADDQKDLIFIGGSAFVVAEAMEYLENR